jgi:hypothetical protein
MKKALLIIFGSLLGLFIIIQFFRPEKNDKPVIPEKDIFYSLTAPAPVKDKITGACYDCHSGTTEYPFYNRIAPVSWLMANHIREGKSKLNFSAWADYDKKTKIKLLTDICDEITAGEMPLKSYVLMHRKAAITEQQVEEVCRWTEQASEQIMKEK